MGSRGRPSFCNISAELVILEVGEARVPHILHKDLLIQESPYFEALFRNAWTETSNKDVVPLRFADYRVFPYFLDWLYFRRLSEAMDGQIGKADCANCGGSCALQRPSDNPSFEIDPLTTEDESELDKLLNKVTDNSHMTALYIFADQYDFPTLRRDLVDHEWSLAVSMDWVPSYTDPINRFNNLPMDSPYCRIIMDIYVSEWSPLFDNVCPTEIKLRSKLPQSFCFALAARLRSKIEDPVSQGIRSLCHYHEHAQDDETRTKCASRYRAEFARIPHIEALEIRRKRKRKEDDRDSYSDSD